MRIPWWAWFVGVWAMTSNKRPRSLAVHVPAGGFSRSELEAAAARLGVPVADLVVAIVMCSERGRSLSWAHGYQAELLAIGHALYGRTRYPRTWSASVVEVALDGKLRTGERGGQFATSSVPQGELLGLLLDWAEQVRTERATGETRGDPLAYHHHPEPKASEINAVWEGRGYVQIYPPGTRPGDATFFAAGPARARAMT